MKLLVTGASGQLGAAAAAAFACEHDVTAATRRDLDITDHQRVMAAARELRPDVVINCAAYNDVDGAEDDAVAALEANAFAVRSLARAAREIGATLVHYSTDFVFDGEADRPYTEEDRPSPQSVYAASKLLGEWFALEAPRAYVLRVESLFGGRAARSSVDRIIEGIRAGRPVRVFVDRVVSPSFVEDVVAATAALLARGAPAGLYHCVNSGQVSWRDLALEVARRLELPATLEEVPMSAVPMRAARPRFCALSNARLAALGIAMPAWQDALGRYLQGHHDQGASRR